MARLRLHLDASIAHHKLHQALLSRGHDVTCTPTYNTKDFLNIARLYPEHHGIILAAQDKWTLSQLIAALDRVLLETVADDWLGQIRWLNQWR